MNMPDFSQVFAFLFLMLGPIKIIAPFAKITVNADAKLTRQLAMRAILFSGICLLVAGFLGERILTNFGIPLPILAIAGGIILFLVALNNVLQQFEPMETHAGSAEPPTMNMALNPLAFPTIVTPYGIAAVIVFLAISPDLKAQLIVGAMVIGILLLNLITMLFAKKIFKPMAVVLPILGAVLSVVQVALGLMIIINQLKTLFNL